MKPELTTSVAEMVAAARERIEEIPAADALGMEERDDVVIVDIRDIRERQRGGFIPGSFHCPRGMAEFWVDPKSPYFKETFAEEKKFVFHCASGWRSALTVATLKDMGFEAAHISDGFGGWEKAGGAIEKSESGK
ncbi:MAG: rhodanese-like domain-containing protein [Pseudomonadota bacterium]